MNTMTFGLLELLLGACGLALGFRGRMSRATMVIAAGLMVLGLSHIAHGHMARFLPDIGGAVILVGLGMTLGTMLRGRRQNRPPGGPPARS